MAPARSSSAGSSGSFRSSGSPLPTIAWRPLRASCPGPSFLLATLLTTWTRSAIALAVTMWISTWWRRHGYDYVHSFGYSQQVASDFAFLFPLEQMPAFTAGFLAFHTI